MINEFQVNYLENQIFEDLISDLRELDINSIDIFNLEKEILNILDNYSLSDDVEPLIEYILEEEIYTKVKKDISSPQTTNIVSVLLLQQIISVYENSIKRTKLANLNYPTPEDAKSPVDKALLKLEAYNVVEKIGNKKTGISYKLKLEEFFKQSDYEIHDMNLLYELAPLIVTYIKTGNIKTFNLEVLFKKISDVMEFAIKPSTLHNNRFELEEKILTTIAENKWNREKQSVEVINKNNENLNIVPKKIIYKRNKKIVIADVLNDNFDVISNDEEFDLYEIKLNESYFEDEELQAVNSDVNPLNNLNTALVSEQSPISSSNNVELLLLEADTIVDDYFKMLPLKSMTFYKTDMEKIEFSEKYRQDTKDNKFYIVAQNNDKQRVFDTVLHTLDYVKILEPKNLNEELVNKFMKYAKEVNINPCDDPKDDNSPGDDEPDTPEVPPSPNSENSTSKSNNKKSNIDAILNLDDF